MKTKYRMITNTEDERIWVEQGTTRQRPVTLGISLGDPHTMGNAGAKVQLTREQAKLLRTQITEMLSEKYEESR